MWSFFKKKQDGKKLTNVGCELFFALFKKVKSANWKFNFDQNIMYCESTGLDILGCTLSTDLDDSFRIYLWERECLFEPILMHKIKEELHKIYSSEAKKSKINRKINS